MVVIGHSYVRELLNNQSTSFALVGPVGVGKSLLVGEWIDYRQQSATVLDKVSITDWNPYLRSLEENSSLYVVLGDTLPATITSRIPTFHVGYLTQDEVIQILTVTFPKLQPRNALARVLNGSFEDFENQVKVAQTLPTIQASIQDRKCPNLRVIDPWVVFTCLKFLIGLEVGKGRFQYKVFLDLQPSSAAEARNQVERFFRSLQ